MLVIIIIIPVNKWGDSRGYDLCIRTGNIPLEKVTDVIIKYVDAKNN